IVELLKAPRKKLKEQEGEPKISSPNLDDNAISKIKSFPGNHKSPTGNDLLQELLSGNRIALSKAISLVESSRPDHRLLANEVIEACLPHAAKSIRIGITGAPGVGKSTFIDTFGSLLTEQGHKVAVLAVDPSSSLSKGSILGDKTRMQNLGKDPNAF